jgi:hypothetical protein
MRKNEIQFKVELDKSLVERFKIVCQECRPRTTLKGVMEMLMEGWVNSSMAETRAKSEPAHIDGPIRHGGQDFGPKPLKGGTGKSHDRNYRK